MSLGARLVPLAEISESDRAAMLHLMDRHYANLAPKLFERDLAQKQWVIQVVDRASGSLCGFSTQMVFSVHVAGRQVTALFSGDTIIAPEYWGDTSFLSAAGELADHVIEKHAGQELYWFLISAGYRTYRFLPVFFREFYPRCDSPTPHSAQTVLDALAQARFGTRYTGGVIRADASQYYLRPGVADLTADRLNDPHVKFFAERNPGHLAGDELCCIAQLKRDNFTAAALRMLRSSAALGKSDE